MQRKGPPVRIVFTEGLLRFVASLPIRGICDFEKNLNELAF